jgi:hypothetical protein
MANNIAAVLKNGVLRLTMPMAAQSGSAGRCQRAFASQGI